MRASLEAGCDAHLAKPVERAVLIEAIYRYTVSDDVVKLVEQTGPSAGEEITPDVAELVPQYLASRDLEVAAGSQEESRIAEQLERLRQFLEQESMPV